MNHIIIRAFAEGDKYAVAEVVKKTLRISNTRDYPEKYIEESIQSHSAEAIRAYAEASHFYVACAGDAVIGCGGITGYWGTETESYLVTVFVLSAYQGRGIDRMMIETMEADEYFHRAWRTEVGSSLSAVHFYRKMDYTYKDGIAAPDKDGVVRPEKRRCP